jgi:hypothetical protein
MYDEVIVTSVDGGWLLVTAHHNKTPHRTQETMGVSKGIFGPKREEIIA